MKINLLDIFLPYSLCKETVKGTELYVLKNKLGYRLGFGYTGIFNEADVLHEGYQCFEIDSIMQILPQLQGYEADLVDQTDIILQHPDISNPLQDRYYMQNIDALRGVHNKEDPDNLFEDLYLPYGLLRLPKKVNKNQGYVVVNRIGGLLGCNKLFNPMSTNYSPETIIENDIVEQFKRQRSSRKGVFFQGNEIVFLNPWQSADPLRDSACLEGLQALADIYDGRK